MSVIKNIPRLRFHNYQVGWETKNIGEVCEIGNCPDSLATEITYFSCTITKDLPGGGMVNETVTGSACGEYLFEAFDVSENPLVPTSTPTLAPTTSSPTLAPTTQAPVAPSTPMPTSAAPGVGWFVGSVGMALFAAFVS